MNHAAVYDTPITTWRCSNTEAAKEGNENAEPIELTTTTDPSGDDNMEFATHDDDVCDNGQEPNDEISARIYRQSWWVDLSGRSHMCMLSTMQAIVRYIWWME